MGAINNVDGLAEVDENGAGPSVEVHMFRQSNRPLENGALPPMPQERAKNPTNLLKKLREEARITKRKWEELADELANRETYEDEWEEWMRNNGSGPFSAEVCD